MGRKRTGWIAFGIAAIAGVIAVRLQRPATKLPSTATKPAIAATSPAPPPASLPAPTPDYLSLVREVAPAMATTQPLDVPLPLSECAKFLLPEPMKLDEAGELWITRADALPLSDVLKAAGMQSIHIVRETVLFVHRQPPGDAQPNQSWSVQFICPASDGSPVLIDGGLAIPLQSMSGAQWDRAMEWNTSEVQGFVVPTADGVTVVQPRATPIEAHISLPLLPGDEPVMLLDARGLLAWGNGSGAARFVDGAWHRLGPDEGWPSKILQLVPLLDGTVLQVITQDDGTVAIHSVHLDSIPIDSKTVQPLIDQLSDPDPAVRDSASAALSRFGPGIWPTLDQAMRDQPPEGAARIRQLLADRDRPTLNGMTVLPGPAQIIARCADGSAILHLTAGVTMPSRNAEHPPTVIAPADLLFEPGQPVKLANALLTHDLPADATIQRAGDEWIVSDAAEGPKRFMENHFEPLLRPSEREYARLIGIDRQGRWLFRRPMTTQPTLVLDPTLPDFTPKLAAWIDPIKADRVGRDVENWPVFVRGKQISALEADHWRLKDAEMSAASPPVSPDSPLLRDSDGTVYSGGLTELVIRHRDGRTTHWPLPPEAIGNSRPWLVRAADGRLYLFNQAGRVVRLNQDRSSFKIEAIFTRQIPNAAGLQRVWIDPAGRIDVMSGDSHLTILFPDGRIPTAIEQMMPINQVNADRSP